MEVLVNQIEKRSWIEVDINQIRNNYRKYVNSLDRDVKVMAVIKADAYGHGDVQVARMLSEEGVELFAVSNIDEAVGIREAGIKGEVLILGYSSPVYARTLLGYDLTQTIVSEEYAEALAATGLKVKCQVAVDTGMNRIGIDGDNSKRCSEIIRHYCKLLNITGIFTHLCAADADTDEFRKFTSAQISKFKAVAEGVEDLHLPYVHYCNSAGGLHYLDSLNGGATIVRLGIILYGLQPDRSFAIPEGIAPAMTWKSVVAMVKAVHPGECIGYDLSFRADRECLIATVTTGYADGYSRSLSNRGFVLVDGHRAPIVGRVCMDQMMIDVTDIPGVKMGDVVILLGRSGNLEYTAEDMAADLGTIGYEVICNITKRVQRFYK